MRSKEQYEEKINFSKIADVLKIRNIIPSGVRLNHDRSLHVAPTGLNEGGGKTIGETKF